MTGRSRLTTVIAAVATVLATLSVPNAAATTPAPPRLTNLAHLDFLTTSVTPPAQAGHDTYRLGSEPDIGVLWVYANHQPDGTFQRVGGGSYDPVHNTYGQGAFDADDIARAAVVYLRHWRQFGDSHSRTEAYELLRGLTYLQTASGPNAGNVVLWMQPDATLTPSATPKDTPDPSDSGASYWLARTIWALGEGYAGFRAADPAFAQFLRQRLDLSVAALHREVLVGYGHYQQVDGLRMPSWLITGGADASSEAVLGLSAYVRAGGSPAARTALAELSDGISAMRFGSPRSWPYSAILPSATSRSMWHAWGAQMTSALATAATTLHRPQLLAAAVSDSAVFTPHLITATGPDNGWLPTPVDGSQIAYGADARFEGLLGAAGATRSSGLYQLAGIAAGWFFGQNPADAATYDPATGVTDDGVSPDGTLNLNSGAESTIHGLLAMEALDAHPSLVPIARAGGHVVQRDGQRTVEAEAAALSGPASVVTPSSAWTGESQWSGAAYVHGDPGSSLSWTVPAASQPQLVQAVIDRLPGRAGTSVFGSTSGPRGSVRYGGGGPQGASPAPGALLPVTLPTELAARSGRITETMRGGSGDLDALLLTPLVSSLLLSGGGHGEALLSSVADRPRSVTVTVAGSSVARATSYDTRGRPYRTVTGSSAGSVTIVLPPGGFAVVQR